jgi:hypothetical protein
MSTVAAPRPPPNPIRSRKPLQRVAVTGKCEASISELIQGVAVLTIVNGEHTNLDVLGYWCKAVLDRDGKINSFELTKFGSGVRYELPADLSDCDCPDHTYREERPGGCRHMQAMRQALLAMTAARRTAAWPGCDYAEVV